MNRSSGIVIFSSAYVMCILAIICCLHIKYDGQGLHHDQLISPQVDQFDSRDKEPIQYVLMNPIRGEFPIQLAQRNSDPNILIASLPGQELPGQELPGQELPGQELPGHDLSAKELASPEYTVELDFPNRQPNVFIAILPVEAETVAVAEKPATILELPRFRKKPNTWDMFKQLGQGITQTPFKLASSKGDHSANEPAPRLHAPNSKTPSLNASPVTTINLEPHVAIANDFEAAQKLKQGLQFLEQIDFDQDFVDSITEQLDEVAFNGAIDPALCEAALYRILGDTEKLIATRHDEDIRLIDAVRNDIIEQIHFWIDQLNGIEPVQLDYTPEDDVDYEKLNTALQSFLWKRVF